MPTYSGFSTTAATSTAGIWYQWIGDSTGTITATSNTDSTWVTWTRQLTEYTTGSGTLTGFHTRVVDPLTAEQIEAECAENLRQIRQQEADDRAARVKAEQLLRESLPADQLSDFVTHGHIVVHGRSGARYRLRQGRTANIDVINRDGRIRHRLCAHPGETMPDFDIMLAQKLWLETDEAAFVKTANVHAALPEQRRVAVLENLEGR